MPGLDTNVVETMPILHSCCIRVSVPRHPHPQHRTGNRAYAATRLPHWPTFTSSRQELVHGECPSSAGVGADAWHHHREWARL